MSRFSARREIAFGLGTYALYLVARRAVWTEPGRRRARRNGERILALERGAGIAVERRLQDLLLRRRGLVQTLNAGYAAFNVTLTVGWLVRLFRRRDPAFHRVRRACVLAHAAAQPVFVLFPAAPPRALPGFVDTLRDVAGIDIEDRLLVRLYNPVAAMPSLHCAFATITGASLAERAGSPLGRAAALVYPPVVAVVVVGTANHYVLDVAAGCALGLIARRLT